MRSRWLTPLLLVVAASCNLGETFEPPRTDPLPPLEAVDHAELGTAKIAFRRIGPFPGTYDGVYWIDAAANTTGSGQQNAVEPSISPDGSRIAFRTPVGGINQFDVFVVSTEGTGLVRLSTEAGNTEGPPSWTPDGRVVYPLFGRPVQVLGQAPIAGSTAEPITQLSPPEGEPCPWMVAGDGPIAVDGTGTLLFTCQGSRIYTMTVDATPQLIAERQTGMGFFMQAVWSPDGQQIAYIEWLEPSTTVAGYARVHRVNRTGGDHTVLATVPHPAGARFWFELAIASLCWTADGSRIVFTAAEGDLVSRVFVVSATGGTVAKVTAAPGTSDGSVSCRR